MSAAAPTRTFGSLALEPSGRHWCLSSLEPHVALRLKNVFSGIQKTQTDQFRVPNSDERCVDLDWFLQRYPLRLAPGDAERLREGCESFARSQRTAETILHPDWKPEGSRFRLGKAPYPFQAQASALTHAMRRLLLADDVGLGKTVSALDVLTRPENLPAAIVVQSHLATQWVKEYIEPFTELRAHIIAGTRPYPLPLADLFIFKYSNIAGWVDIAGTGVFRSVVYDEVQELRRGTKSAKGEAARVFTDKADLRMGLSATPIYNYGEEIFHVMAFIAPGALGALGDFSREWCKDGRVVTDPDALGTYLRENNLMLRRVRSGQPVNTVTIEVPYDEAVEAEHQDLARVLAVKVVSGSFVERGQAARELDILMRQITGVAKARHVAAYVRILLEAGEPVLLTGWHRDVYAIWLEELAAFDPVLYTGSESARQKDAAKAAFIEGRTNLMIISLRSGAGLDGLQKRCHTLVFGELDWSPKIHEQVIGRLDRPGQTAREVTAIFLHTDGGSDPLIIDMLGLKASQAKGIVDPLSAPQHVHTDESRIRLLAEQYLARRAA